MLTRVSTWLALGWFMSAPDMRSAELVQGRLSLVFNGQAAQLMVDLAGGSMADFHFRDQPLNPLHWGTPPPGDIAPRPFGHFLCLDRWGAPSAAEGANGMPYHGEATRVTWQASGAPAVEADVVRADLTARLPLAGLSVKRTLRLSANSAFCTVREEFKNENKLGRIYNAVQHPTLGPPFLDETTIVDSNARKGFAQGGSLPDPEEPSFYWPQTLNRDGETVNLRHLTSDPNPNVVSYVIDDEHGWVTAATPGQGLLIGYRWQTSDYPWLSLWRDTHAGKPSARGLEFGTTGLHQPYPVLARKGRIFGRLLFEHLDAGETAVKSYAAFLLKVPADFAGVESLKLETGRLILRERGGAKSRTLSVDTGGLLPP